ncbi:hypothetical protein [Microbacterium suaedae]|uniref:hypothetical protein n=1 Tax=Microbacterium suaedae TaxID=2067813 RepID=UPI0013A60DAA|nr:hypothetical protein [Microbacterium suaedae]
MASRRARLELDGYTGEAGCDGGLIQVQIVNHYGAYVASREEAVSLNDACWVKHLHCQGMRKNMSSDRSIVLHVGAHKTASTLLQRAMSQQADDLERDGLAVTHRRDILDTAFFRNLKQIVISGNVPSPSETEVSKRDFGQLVDRDASRVLLTNENFLENFRKPRFYRNAKVALSWISDLSDDPLSIVLFTRSQPDYIESMYMQRLHLGESIAFDEASVKYANLNMSWASILDDVSDVLGRESVTSIPYEAVKRVGATGYYRAFLAACGVDGTTYEIPAEMETSRSANRSYSGEAMKLALAINPLIPRQKRKVFRKYLQENYSTATHPKAELFSEAERATILELYAEENLRLFVEHMPDWREDAAAYGVSTT